MKTKLFAKNLIGTGLSAVIIVVLAHLPLWLVRPYAALPQPLFELDLLAAIAVFSLNRWLGGMAIFVAWSLSLLRAVAVNYHFHNVAEFIDASRFANLVSYSAFMTPVNLLVGCLVILMTWVIFHSMALTRSKPLPVLVLTLLLELADVLNGSATTIALGRDKPFLAFNMLGSPSYNLFRAEQNFWRDARQPLAAINPVPRSYVALRASAERGHGSYLLILVESLGMPQQQEIYDWLLDQLRTSDFLSEWELSEGAESFFGGTVAGELRVLCGLRGHYSRLTEAMSQDCLPRRFLAHGEDATAMHGFSPRMFDRAEWWPVAGFTQTRFSNDWATKESAHCPGAFNGICDHDVIASAIRLAGKRQQFVYALTINTHLPLPSQKVGQELRTLCQHHGVPDAACQLVQAQGNLLADLRAQLIDAPNLLCQVVVVGDHSPPFIDVRDRGVFKPTQVPSFILQRRQTTCSTSGYGKSLPASASGTQPVDSIPR